MAGDTRGRKRTEHEPRIIELLLAGYTCSDIGRMFGIPANTALRVAKRNGIQPKHGIGRNTRPRVWDKPKPEPKPEPKKNVAESGKWTALRRQFRWDDGQWQ